MAKTTSKINATSANRAAARPRRAVLAALLLLAWLLLLAACAEEGAPPPAAQTPAAPAMAQDSAPATPSPPAPSPTPPPPTPTPQLAALVNGQPILLADYETELARYEMAQEELGLAPGADGSDYRQLVLDALIEKELLRQTAVAAGVAISAQMVDERLAELREAAADHIGFDAWLATNKWTPESFRAALADEMMVAVIIDQITAEVPYTAEQVRARYLQVDDGALAELLLAQINEGADFGELARAHSRDLITGPAGGDLGFFARGSLLVSQVEEAAFALQPEQVSDVIAVTDEAGATIYYIVQLMAREPERPLSTDRRAALLQATYDAWLAEQLAGATIINMLDG